MKISITLIALLSVLFISGCSGTYQAYYNTLKLVFAEFPNSQLSLTDVEQSKIDLIAVKRGDRPQIVMALAYLEDGQHKWISADKAMLIMQQDRIIKTVGLDKDLLYLSNTLNDPLKQLPEHSNATWLRAADWSGDEYGHTIESKFVHSGTEKVTALGKSIDTMKYIENVHYTVPSRFIMLNRAWKNIYWLDKTTNTLVRSIQTLGPKAEAIETVYLSRIARLGQLENAHHE